MKASIVDLRYKMRDILKALMRNERITIISHGKIKGFIMPALHEGVKKVSEHPFFGSQKPTHLSVTEEMDQLRGPRYNAF